MYESDTMFNKRDRRCCTTHALYRSKLWQQDHCQHPQNANPDGSTLEGTAQPIGRPFGGSGVEAQGWGHPQEDPDQRVHRKGSDNHWWNSPAVWWSPGAIRWPAADLGVSAGLGAGQQVQRDPGLASEGALRLCTLLSLALFSRDLNPLDYFVLSYVENITNITSHNTKARVPGPDAKIMFGGK